MLKNTEKMKELNIDSRDPKVLKFVGYYPETAHFQNMKAL